MLCSAAGRIAEAALTSLPAHYSNVWLDTSVVMPNHVHMIIALQPFPEGKADGLTGMEETKGLPRPSLAQIVGSYKSEVSRLCHAAGISAFGWQSRYYDHVLRGPRTVDAVRDYILNNPQNWEKDSDYFEAA